MHSSASRSSRMRSTSPAYVDFRARAFQGPGASGNGQGLALLTSTTDRSWHNMLQVGSTMTLEAWDAKMQAEPRLEPRLGRRAGQYLAPLRARCAATNAGLRARRHSTTARLTRSRRGHGRDHSRADPRRGRHPAIDADRHHSREHERERRLAAQRRLHAAPRRPSRRARRFRWH
jgi:hypothetical protein